MIRKYIFYISLLLVLFFQHSLSAQIKDIKKADEYFFDFNYRKAIQLYKEIKNNGDAEYYTAHRIGDCYRHLGNVEESVNWYLQAIEYPDVDMSSYLLLAQQLKKLHRYNESNQYLQKYNEMAGVEPSNILSESKLKLLKKDSLRYKIYSLPVNSPYSEIGPALYNDKLVFCSNKGEIRAFNRTDIRDGEQFYKLYYSKINTFSNLSQPRFFSRKLSTKYNDGPIAFNQDKTIAFITRNVDSSDDKKSYLNIFVSNKVNGHWQKDVLPIPLHQFNYSLMHGFLTHDEKRFFFVSDMEGGFGGFDIYYSYIKDGFLSTPVNLGPQVNSSENEMFPYVAEDGILYYSSDKEAGLGGMDVFFALPIGEGFSNSFNMGYPINTADDDFGLIYLENQKFGYFVSNREGGVGQDDIYAFEQNKSPRFSNFKGRVLTDSEWENVEGATVNFYWESDLLYTTSTDKNGEFSIYLEDMEHFDGDGSYVIEVKKRFFKPFKSDVQKVVEFKGTGYSIEVLLLSYQAK